MLQNSRPCSGSASLHGPLHRMIAGADDSNEFEELDPSARYGRYKDVLGRGAFKVVYKGFDIVDGIEVAWNQIKVHNALHTAEDIDRFYSEVHLLKTLKHKNIIKFYHSWVDMDAMNINFLTEIFTSGTLRQYRRKHKCIDIRAIKKWSRQILRGLLYLHSQDPPVMHRDLKCDNIFINGNQGEVKIGDLGLATILNQAHAAQTVIGTPEFMAPELYEAEYTELVDIYSFGMCLLEMVTGEYPYSECANSAQIYKKVTSGIKPAALCKIKNPQLQKFIEQCIAVASRRLPARELLMDPFLQGEEVCVMIGDAYDVHQTASRSRSSGSLSDVQTSFGDRILASSGSFSNLTSSTLHQDHSMNSPSLVHGPFIKQYTFPALYPGTAGHNYPPISYPTGDKVGQTRDFQIKGKCLEDGTIQLRLRIADAEGEIRVIHFPFDVVHDTALSVASEMVEELDLVDEDVTQLAEVIENAVQTFVPSLIEKQMNTRSPTSNENQCKHTPLLPEICLSGETMTATQPSWRKEHSVASLNPLKVEATVHGRFEEISFHHNTTQTLNIFTKCPKWHHHDLCDDSMELNKCANNAKSLQEGELGVYQGPY